MSKMCWLAGFCGALMGFAQACQREAVVRTPTGRGNSDAAGGLAPKNPTETSDDGDFFRTGNSVAAVRESAVMPAALKNFLRGRTAAISVAGVQRICLEGDATPCRGRLRLGSGEIVQLGKEGGASCVFWEHSGLVDVSGVDALGRVEFHVTVPAVSFAADTEMPVELQVGREKITIISGCSI